MVFVADVIPPELQRIVEFLNQQTDPAEVLAVEIKQYVGESMRTLVPRVVGQSAAVQQRKASSAKRVPVSEADFFADARDAMPGDEVDVLRAIVDLATQAGLHPSYKRGTRYASFLPRLDAAPRPMFPISATTSGVIYLQMVYLVKRPPFNNETVRSTLHDKLSEVAGFQMTDVGMSGYPLVRYRDSIDSSRAETLIEILQWFFDELKKCTGEMADR